MKLRELLDLILDSNADDWNRISCWGFGSGPSYKNDFTFYEVYEGQDNILNVKSHSELCIYKDNIDITMAYGLTANDDFRAEWANKFPDPKAYSKIVDIFYKNSLVFRETYLVVDGGRCEVPIPGYNSDGELVVGDEYHKFIQLLENISNGTRTDSNFNRYFKNMGIKVINEEWM